MVKSRTDENSFNYQGEFLQFTILEEMYYENQAVDLCLYYEVRETQELSTGTYNVDIFVSDYVIGSATFTLR